MIMSIYLEALMKLRDLACSGVLCFYKCEHCEINRLYKLVRENRYANDEETSEPEAR